MLNETDRERFATEIANVALTAPDSGFLNEYCKRILTSQESENILMDIRKNLIPKLDEEIDIFKTNYEPDEDPEWHFSDLKNTLDDLLKEFEGLDDECLSIDAALNRIEQLISDLNIEHEKWQEDEDIESQITMDQKKQIKRSIFEDVDVE